MTYQLDFEALARLNPEYRAITSEELVADWEVLSEQPAQPIEGVLGVLTPPAQEPRSLLSVDLCDVLRHTGHDYRQAIGLPPVYTHDYLGDVQTDGRDIYTSTIQRLMNDGLVGVTTDIGAIGAILRDLRRDNTLVIANTSTLVGCERATIDERFMATHLNGCFDGIVFPRNFDGTGPMTKALAATMVLDQVGLDSRIIPVVHIDDAPHHIRAFRDTFADNPRLGLFMPAHEGNKHNVGLRQYLVDTALQGFEAAAQHITQYREDVA